MQKSNILILIVDDAPDILQGTARIVKNGDYQVITATTGKECLDQAHKHRPDLILLDVVLPDIEGTEVCRTIKSDADLKGTFVVLLSGKKVSTDEQADGLNVGADGYIARPISNKELLARVNSMVRIAVAEKERDQLIVELKTALEKVKQLSGLLPLCSHCKKIRDDKGYWNQIDAYIEEHSEADFSHSICPDCAEEFHPDMKLYEKY